VRDIEITGTWTADALGGAYEIRARDLTLNGGKLRSLGNSTSPGGEIGVVLGGTFKTKGSGPTIDTSGNGGGGLIRVIAAAIDLQTGTIRADGGNDQNCGGGGAIGLEAYGGALSSAITVKSTTGGNQCGGGSITMTGESVAVSGDVDAHGGAWASFEAITLAATETNVTVSSPAELNADGTGQPDGVGADGGQITIAAPLGSISLGASAVTAVGKSPYGAGGGLSLEAGQNIASSSRVTIQSGSNGFGGILSADAGGTLTVTGEIVATGGGSLPDGEGGDVDLSSVGSLLISSVIDASAVTGGRVAASSGGVVSVSGTLDVRGSRYAGGQVELTGCSVQVDGTVDAAASNGGEGGYVSVEAVSISAGSTSHIVATPCLDNDCVAMTTGGNPPGLHPSADISPAPDIFVFPGLSCGS